MSSFSQNLSKHSMACSWEGEVLTNQAGNAAALSCLRPLPQLVCGLQLVSCIAWVLLLHSALLVSFLILIFRLHYLQLNATLLK